MISSWAIGVVILAAGSSSRLGQPKQLVQYEGKSLLQRTIDESHSSNFIFRAIVHGYRGEAIISSLDLKDFTPVENPGWAEGIASSIRAGIDHALTVIPDLGHLMFLLSDQPFINSAVLQRLVRAHSQNNKGITVSRYDGDIGVPAIFSKAYFPELQALKGDQGAKKIILQAKADSQIVDFPKGEFDIDTPADMLELEKLNVTRK